MAGEQVNVQHASINILSQLNNRASAAAHAKFAEWQKQERDQRPRRILMFTLAAGVITVAAALVTFFSRS